MQRNTCSFPPAIDSSNQINRFRNGKGGSLLNENNLSLGMKFLRPMLRNPFLIITKKIAFCVRHLLQQSEVALNGGKSENRFLWGNHHF
ncbi:hypothetical protein CEXT_666581 [Caerostris extrusa]|uniref:Uncharacterized protein n=1 Tax=Caerostris extrusa TaxID=172846 RepID=A0AAV4MVX8_CAEEX|nr:hypothetical protein CEXT_666581 [Caerostris extrusa]